MSKLGVMGAVLLVVIVAGVLGVLLTLRLLGASDVDSDHPRADTGRSRHDRDAAS